MVSHCQYTKKGARLAPFFHLTENFADFGNNGLGYLLVLIRVQMNAVLFADGGNGAQIEIITADFAGKAGKFGGQLAGDAVGIVIKRSAVIRLAGIVQGRRAHDQKARRAALRPAAGS